MGDLKLEGIIVPIVTPLDKNEQVDRCGMERLIKYVLEGGVHGIFVMGSSGEFPAITDEERKRAIEIVVEEVNRKVPVLVGISACSTKEAIRYGEEARKIGADAIVATLPYYYKLDRDTEIVDHFQNIVDHSELPLLLYNIPSYTKSYLDIPVIKRLSRHSKFIGMKDGSGDFTFFHKLIRCFRDSRDFVIFQGDERLLLVSFLAGAKGGVLGLANVAPRLCVNLYKASRNHNWQTGTEYQKKLLSLCEFYLLDGHCMVAIKKALSLLGICDEKMTKPFQPLSEENALWIERKLKKLDLLTSCNDL